MAAVKPPAGLKTAGKALWRDITAGLGEEFELDERERVILAMACRQVDDIDGMERELKRLGLVVQGSMGQPRLSPIVTELRQARIAVARLLGELELPDAEGVGRSARSRQAQRAAQASWSARRSARGA